MIDDDNCNAIAACYTFLVKKKLLMESENFYRLGPLALPRPLPRPPLTAPRPRPLPLAEKELRL